MDIEMLTFGHAGLPIIIFPTTLGSYYEAKDFLLIDSIRWFIDQGRVKVYCPDGVNKYSWYNKNVHPSVRVQNHIYYDQFIRNELVEGIRQGTHDGRVALCFLDLGLLALPTLTYDVKVNDVMFSHLTKRMRGSMALFTVAPMEDRRKLLFISSPTIL